MSFRRGLRVQSSGQMKRDWLSNGGMGCFWTGCLRLGTPPRGHVYRCSHGLASIHPGTAQITDFRPGAFFGLIWVPNCRVMGSEPRGRTVRADCGRPLGGRSANLPWVLQDFGRK
jgi:hypothetical protein